MTLLEQACQRVAAARQLGREPVRWIATAEVATQLSDHNGQLVDVPVDFGKPISDWGLDLVLAPA